MHVRMHGRSYHIRKNALRNLLNQKYGLIQNECGKAIKICLVPILVGLYMMALSALRLPFKGYNTN